MPNARLAPAILISLSLILQGCFFEQDPLPETQEEKQSDLIAEAADDGGSAAAPNANGEASVTDLETGLSVSVSKDALSGLAAGDNFVLQVTPLNENEVPAGSSAIQIAGQVFNIKIRSVNTGEELQPTGGMKVTLPYGSTINGTDIQKLAIANYHDNEWVIFAADSIDDVKKTVTATITQLSPVAVVKNNAINSAPVAPDYTGTILEDDTYSLKINATDADGDGLVYSWLDDTTGEKVADNASLDAAGNFSYQPLENFNGQTVLQYKVSDGELSDTGSITITVEGVNDAPVAADYTATIAEDGTYNVVLQATDIDSNALTYSWLDGTTGEKVADNASLDAAGNFIYQPLENFNGQTVLQYKVSDGQFTDTGSITITVEGVNDAPVAGDYTGTIIEGTPIYGVKLSATDIDGDALTYSWLDGTTGGKPAYNAGLDAAGNFNYQPPENYFGINVFHYKVSDGELTDTGTITVTVTGVNDAPVAMSSSLNVTGNAGSQGTLSATDVDGDTYFTYAIVSQPEHGTVTISGSTFTYIPDGNYEGEDSFEFTANDGALDSAPGTVTLSLSPAYRYVLEDGTGDGTSWNNATSSVQSAINDLVALGGGRVLIGPGTFYADSANTPVATIPEYADVELYGGFNGYNLTFAQRPEILAETILSGDYDQSGDFSEDDSPSVVITYGGLIDGVTVSGGNGTRGGGVFVNGGQYANGGHVTLNQVVVENNQASEMGGGIYLFRDGTRNGETGEYVFDAYLTISNSTVSDNTAPNGGGIYNADSELTITDSTLQNNSVTEFGGAIYSGGPLSIDHSNIRENTFTTSGPSEEECQAAQSYEEALALGCISQTYAAGGGLYLINTSATITNTQIEKNTSEWGAGIYLAGQPSLTMDQVSVSHNEAAGGAAGIYNEYGLVTISRSHINYNTAENSGGAFYNAAENQQESEEEEEGPGEEGCLGACGEEGPYEGPDEECGLDCMEGGSEEPELTVYEQCDYAESQEEYDALDCDTVFENYDTCDELDLYNSADVATFNELQCAEQFPSEFSADDIPAVFQNCPNDFATLKLSDSEIVGNEASSGGALYNYGSVCITGTSFRYNAAYTGGAIRNDYSGDGSSLLVTNSSFVGNTASGSATNSNGGALYTIGYGSTSVLQNVSFSQNSAESNGGAIWVYSNATVRINNFTFYDNIATEGQDVFVGGVNASNSYNGVDVAFSNGCSEQDLSAYASSYNLFSYAGDFATENSVIMIPPFNTAASGELFMDQNSVCANAGDADTATAAFDSLEAWSGLTSDMDYSTTQETSGMVAAGALYSPEDLWIKIFSATGDSFNFSTNQLEASCDLYADGEMVAEDVQDNSAHNQSTGTELTLICASPVGYTKSATTIAGGLMVP